MNPMQRLAVLAVLAVLGVLGVLLPFGASATPAAEPGSATAAQVEAGRRLYVEGVLPSGAPLVGLRRGAVSLSGAQAACAACHRASGMGGVEGMLRVPPINARYLFPQAGDLHLVNVDGIRGKALARSHAPYDTASLERVLHEGFDVGGRLLGDVMPRYDLAADDRAALLAYLQQLSVDYSPGASRQKIRFAVVVTPGVTPARREAFEAMIHAAVVAKNGSTQPRKRYMTTAATFVSQTERRWEVETWALTGAPATWAAQLDERYRQAPVFALLSGLSETTWTPVDEFCRRQQVPCWFPSVRLPSETAVPAGLYFSRGIVLEAEVLARVLKGQAGPAPRQVLSVHAGDSLGRAASAALQSALGTGGPTLQTRVIADLRPDALRKAIGTARPGDVLALWLTAEQLPLLDGLAPPPGVQVFFSGSLVPTGPKSPMPVAWRSTANLVYPFELSPRRAANLAYMHSWLKLNGLPLVDEVMQSEVFFALNLMTDTLQDMLDNLYRDYLVERAEDMLGKRESIKAEQESRDRRTLGRVAVASVAAEARSGLVVSDAPDAAAAQRRAYGQGDSEGTSVYPRLSLGPGQHFASKGAYIVRYGQASGEQPAGEPDWIVP